MMFKKIKFGNNTVKSVLKVKNVKTKRCYAEKTHFGFREIEKEDKESMVGDVFHRVADSYDVMNDVMSVGIHRLWKDTFVKKLNLVPGVKIVDVAGGTGDISFRMIDSIKSSASYVPSFKEGGDEKRSEITVVDINPNMLKVGKERAVTKGYLGNKDENILLQFKEGNAEHIDFVEDNSVDIFTIAFGIRNCTNVDKVCDEAYRILRPGGRFMVLEFSKVDYPLSTIYDAYSFNMIPVLGQLVANDYDSYQYLVESIRQFPDQEKFANMLKTSGFKKVTWENLNSGIVAIHSGFKL